MYLTTDPARLEWARKFGAELQRAMTARKMRPHHVFKAAGGGYSHFSFDAWLKGRALPRLDRAIRLADALDWPKLAELCRRARTGHCQRENCGREFVTEAGKCRMYCSPACYKLVHEYGVGYAHAERKKVGGAQAQLLKEAAEGRASLEERDALRRAVGAMCADCEPEGYCRTAACPLRSVSPLPLARAHVTRDRRVLKREHHRWGIAS